MKFAKHILTFFLLFAFLLQIFGKLAVITNYAINKEYIAKVFCVNKDKPKKQCNGKCHLKKQLKEQDKKEQSPINPLKEGKEFQLFYSVYDGLLLYSQAGQNLSTIHFTYLDNFTEKHLQSVFHPPAA